MKTERLILLVCVFCFFGCEKTNIADILEKKDQPNNSGIITVQERDKDYPLINYADFKKRSNRTKAIESNSFKDFIGCSYKLDFYPYENAQNLGFPVINVDKYLLDHPTWCHVVPVKDGSSEYYSYSNFERYELKVNKTKTVKTGFKLDFKIFSIGSQNTYKKVFKSSDIKETQRVFGELSIRYYDEKYELLVPEYIDLKKYIYKDFSDQLYYGTISELFKNYGGFVLTKFLSGGQAFALYNGLYKSNIHEEEKITESSMDMEINASFELKNPPKTRSEGGMM